MMTKKGLFITFEGIDGSGKSTQLDLLCELLEKNNIDFIKTRDPGGTDLGLKLRDILLHYKGKMAPLCELYLYLADRAQHVEEKLLPSLKEGKIVICDRYLDSTLAYQGYARGLDIAKILELNSFASQGLMPDLTLIFDITAENASKRLGKVKDRLESEQTDFHKKVRDGYLDLAKNSPQRIKVLNAEEKPEEIQNKVVEIIKKYIDF
jgi:dTMP kinase